MEEGNKAAKFLAPGYHAPRNLNEVGPLDRSNWTGRTNRMLSDVGIHYRAPATRRRSPYRKLVVLWGLIALCLLVSALTYAHSPICT